MSTYELRQVNPGIALLDLDSRKAAEIAKHREKWKSLWPSKRC